MSRQNLQLGTFTLRVLEDSHPKLAAQILRGRSLRGWYKTMFEGEEFDEEAWAVEREGIASPEEPKGSSHSQHNQRKAESKDDAKSNNEEGDSISRPSTAQSTRTKKALLIKRQRAIIRY